MEKERTGYWGKDSAGGNYPPIFGIPLILGIILIAFLFMWKLVPVEVDGAEDKPVLSEQFESPTDYSQYTNANEHAKLLSDGSYTILKYKDTICNIFDSSTRFRWNMHDLNIFFIQTWIDQSKNEYIDLYYWYDFNVSNMNIKTYLGKMGSSSQGGHFQFVYENGRLIQTSYKFLSKNSYLLDPYVYDNQLLNIYMYLERIDGKVLINGEQVLYNAPSPYDFKYATTFRMLTGDTLISNTYYYDNCYKAGDDIIKCVASANETQPSGRYVAVEILNLKTGQKTVTHVANPSIFCQISSYGTVYDIVSTNDTNLLSLLGISKPEEKYWDVASQTWKPVFSGGIGGGGNAGGEIGGGIIGGGSGDGGTTGKFDFNYSLSPLENFSRWLATKGYPVASGVAHFFSFEFIEDAGDYLDQFGEILSDYLDYFVYNEEIQRFGLSKDGLGENWKKLKESAIADSVTDEFINRFKFDETVKHYTWSSQMISTAIPGLNAGLVLNSGGSTGGTGGDGSGTGGTGGNGSGSTGGGGTGGNGSGSTGGGGTGGNGSGGTGGSGSGGGDLIIGGPQWDAIGEFGSNVQGGIVEGVTSTGSFLSGVLGSVKGILEGLGSLPVLLADLYSFLPSEITLALGVGLGLWILPALLGLARTGLKSIGNMFSSLFGLISSLFS